MGTSSSRVGSLDGRSKLPVRPSEPEHAGSERLVEEQAALRRVATLVARRASPDEVFETVAAEVAKLLAW